MSLWPLRDRFFDVPRTVARTSEGLVDLPILYYDVTNVVALFRADLRGVEELLRGTGLAPAVVDRASALVGLSFYEYRRTTVGRYNEVGVAIFAVRDGEARPALRILDLLVPPRRRKLGAYVVDLPVTTAAANAAGRELWGYPKFVTEIPFELDGPRFRSSVLDPANGTVICELAGTFGRAIPGPPISIMTYSTLDGALVRTHVDVRGPVGIRSAGDATLRLGPSRHPMTDRLRTLGLDGARPAHVVTAERFQSKLHAGSRVA